MPMLYTRILEGATIADGDEMDLASALDVGEARELEIILTVVEAGDGDNPKLVVRHAPINAEDSYLDFETTVEIELTATGRVWFHVDKFTRWLGWFTSGTITSGAVVTLEVLAKG